MKVQPLTDEIAARAGAISGQQSRRGIIIPFADLQGKLGSFHEFDSARPAPRGSGYFYSVVTLHTALFEVRHQDG
jgi:hypothetical protein